MKKNPSTTEATTYSVREICTLTGVTRKTLFYYDRISLLEPYDRVGVQNHKIYDAAALERLRQILLYRDAGLQIDEIRYVLDNADERRTVLMHVLERLMREAEQKTEQISRVRILMEEE